MDKNYIYMLLLGIVVGISGTYLIIVDSLQENNDKLNKQIVMLNQLLNERNNVLDNKELTISYVPKNGKSDNDIELKENHTIKVGIDNQQYELPTKIVENNKFDNGKLIIEKQQSTVIDISKASEEMAALKAKEYSRVGKVDFGCIYNRKENDLYGGVRYNAKTWDVGYYHNVDNSDWLIGLHYKF